MFVVSQFNEGSPTAPEQKAAIVQLLNVAYGFPVIPARVDRFAVCEPDAWQMVHFQHGAERTLVGVGASIAYPNAGFGSAGFGSAGYGSAGFGWVGLIATDPQFERQGIGRMVTEACIAHLQQRGCSAVLDASAAGAPLYRRMGFLDKGQSALRPRWHHDWVC